jgi:hypothetical protein
MVSGSTGLHCYDAPWVLLHERHELLARQLLAEHHFTFRRRTMQLKDLLRQVNAND